MDQHGTLTLDRTPRPYTEDGRVPEQTDTTPRLYTVAEVAGIVRMSPKWVLRKIADGLLPAKLIVGGGNAGYRITAADLAAFVEALPDARSD